MHQRSPQLLESVRDAAGFILEVTQSVDLERYRIDRLLRHAVERNFEIIGEAIKRLATTDPETASRITHHAQIIAFRNVLIHGYDLVDHALVLATAQQQVPRLLAEVEGLLAEG
jgi:uncharacterized protein with HEPN domain